MSSPSTDQRGVPRPSGSGYDVGAFELCDDAVAPPDPGDLSSPTHTTSQWSAAGLVETQWSGATDSGCAGVAGYSVLFDTSPTTVPDTVVDVPHSTGLNSTSGSLADGADHWFHVRTCDVLGNCSAGVHLGPFWIDTSAPTDPGALSSPTHTTSQWSAAALVEIEWSVGVVQADIH